MRRDFAVRAIVRRTSDEVVGPARRDVRARRGAEQLDDERRGLVGADPRPQPAAHVVPARALRQAADPHLRLARVAGRAARASRARSRRGTSSTSAVERVGAQAAGDRLAAAVLRADRVVAVARAHVVDARAGVDRVRAGAADDALGRGGAGERRRRRARRPAPRRRRRRRRPRRARRRSARPSSVAVTGREPVAVVDRVDAGAAGERVGARVGRRAARRGRRASATSSPPLPASASSPSPPNSTSSPGPPVSSSSPAPPPARRRTSAEPASTSAPAPPWIPSTAAARSSPSPRLAVVGDAVGAERQRRGARAVVGDVEAGAARDRVRAVGRGAHQVGRARAGRAARQAVVAGAAVEVALGEPATSRSSPPAPSSSA